MGPGVWLTGVGLLAAFLLLPWVAAGAYRSPAWGLAIVSVPLVARSVTHVPTVGVAGYSVDMATDPAGLVLLVVGALRLSGRWASSSARLAVVLGVLFGIALLRGMYSVGPTGHLEFSRHLLILSVIAYAVSFDFGPKERRQILRVLVLVTGALALVVFARWVGVLPRGRGVLDAGATFVIAQTALVLALLATEWRRSTVLLVTLAGGMLGLAVLLQHRTVWIAAAAGLTYVVARSGYRGARLMSAFAAGLAMLVAVQFVGADTGRDQFRADTVWESLRNAADDDRTWEWRRDYWRYTWETHVQRGPVAVVLGAGYGAPWMTVGPRVDRLEGPHNQYVEIVVRYGVVGVAAWVALLIWTAMWLWRTRRTGKGTGLSNDALLAILVTQIVWSVGYGLSRWQPILLGLCVSAALTAARSPDLAAPAQSSSTAPVPSEPPIAGPRPDRAPVRARSST